MVTVTEHAEGWILPVRAQPGARRNGVVGEQAGALKVAVSAPPEDGRANKAITEVLRNALSVRRSEVEMLSGQTGKDKRFLIRGLSKKELETRIEKLIPRSEGTG
jgi:uncharacterized protein (TIGR00251 family)